MKIISSYRDYYDSAMALGHDDRLMFRRESQTWSINGRGWRWRRDVLDQLTSKYHCNELATGLLLFCGRAWPVWRIQPTYWGDKEFVEVLPNTHFGEYWLDKLDELDALPNSDPERLRYRGLLDQPYLQKQSAKDLRPWIRSRMAQQTGIALGEDFLISEKIPSCLIVSSSGPYVGRDDRTYTLISNPCLKDLGFARYMDAFQAYQTIETFLGNQLAEVDRAPLRVGSDEVVARQKGFDDFSFRNASPGIKKQNRKANRARKRGQP